MKCFTIVYNILRIFQNFGGLKLLTFVHDKSTSSSSSESFKDVFDSKNSLSVLIFLEWSGFYEMS